MKITGVHPGHSNVDLDSLDLLDPRIYSNGDPHAIWAAMRERAPLHRQVLPDGREFWSVTRHEDVKSVLGDHVHYTSARGTILSILGGVDPASGKMMAASDPPVHTAIRTPMHKLFTTRAAWQREPQIRRVIHRMLAPLLNGETWDVARIGLGFPMAFTGTFMGIPEADWPRLTKLTTMAVAPDDADYQEPDGNGSLAATHHELFAYFNDQVKWRIKHKSDEDFIGFLVQLEMADRKLRRDEIVYNCYSMLLGANVTTPHTVTGTVLALIENPAEYQRLRQDTSLIPSAIEEGLRWATPTNHFVRHVTQDITRYGRKLRAGDAIVAWLGSANRDEAVFADPYRFDVSRSPNPHMGFGFGPHYCIGAPLARVAMRLLFEEIVATVAAFELAGPIEHLMSNFVAGIKTMPLTARLRDGAAQTLDEAFTADGPVPL
jgi:cytochrome P450